MKTPQQLARTRDSEYIGRKVKVPYCQEKAGTLYTYIQGIEFDAEMSRHVAASLRNIGHKLLEVQVSKSF